MGNVRPNTRPRTAQRRLFLVLVSLLALCIPLLLAGPAGAGPLTGGFSPTIVGGGADLDGNGVVNGSDDANAFYGDTSIIDGKLDCDAWGVVANTATRERDRSRSRTTARSSVTTERRTGSRSTSMNGFFQVGDGPLPTVFNAGDPDNARRRRFRLRLVGDRRPRGLERQRRHRQRRLPRRARRRDDDSGSAIRRTNRRPRATRAPINAGSRAAPNTADNGLVDLNDDRRSPPPTRAPTAASSASTSLPERSRRSNVRASKATRATMSSARPVTTRSSARQAATSSADEAVTTGWWGPAQGISSSALAVQTSPAVETAAMSCEEGAAATGSSAETPAIASSATAATTTSTGAAVSIVASAGRVTTPSSVARCATSKRLGIGGSVRLRPRGAGRCPGLNRHRSGHQSPFSVSV